MCIPLSEIFVSVKVFDYRFINFIKPKIPLKCSNKLNNLM